MQRQSGYFGITEFPQSEPWNADFFREPTGAKRS